jgi:hypothetical protein
MCTAPEPAKSIAPELNSRFGGWDLRRARRGTQSLARSLSGTPATSVLGAKPSPIPCWYLPVPACRPANKPLGPTRHSLSPRARSASICGCKIQTGSDSATASRLEPRLCTTQAQTRNTSQTVPQMRRSPELEPAASHCSARGEAGSGRRAARLVMEKTPVFVHALCTMTCVRRRPTRSGAHPPNHLHVHACWARLRRAPQQTLRCQTRRHRGQGASGRLLQRARRRPGKPKRAAAGAPGTPRTP